MTAGRARDGRTGPAALELATARPDLAAAADRPLLGVGVGSPGVVDPTVVLEAPNLGWHGVDLAAPAQALDVPVHVANDANAATLAELASATPAGRASSWSRSARVSAQACHRRRALIGDRFAAGEIGHVVVDPRRPACVAAWAASRPRWRPAPAPPQADAGDDRRGPCAGPEGGGWAWRWPPS